MNEQGLGSCWESFREENFTTLSSLFALTPDDLKELGLRMGERKNFLVGLNHLASYSNDRFRAMNLVEAELEKLSIAAQNFLEKVIRRFSYLIAFDPLSEILKALVWDGDGKQCLP